MIEFGKGRVSFKAEAGWHDLGKVTASIITLKSGRKIRSGDRAAIFDMELSPDDKQLLAEMKVGNTSGMGFASGKRVVQ